MGVAISWGFGWRGGCGEPGDCKCIGKIVGSVDGMLFGGHRGVVDEAQQQLGTFGSESGEVGAVGVGVVSYRRSDDAGGCHMEEDERESGPL